MAALPGEGDLGQNEGLMPAYEALAEVGAMALLGADAMEPFEVADIARTIGERAMDAETVARNLIVHAISEEVGIPDTTGKLDVSMSREDYGTAILPVGSKVETVVPGGNAVDIHFTNTGIVWNDRRGKMDSHALFVLSILLRFPRLRFDMNNFLNAGFFVTHPDLSARQRKFSQIINGLRSDIQTNLARGDSPGMNPIEVTKREDGNLYAWRFPVNILG